MKFVIEIYGTALDGSDWLLHRTTITAFNPLVARKAAESLLAARKKAAYACVLNTGGQTVYRISK